MTADRRAALVEKVANAMWEADPYYASRELAALAIDLIHPEVLEEAAMVCDRMGDRQMHPHECAAVIRALKEKS